MVIEKFFHPYLTFNAQLPTDFKGTFSLSLDKSQAYTYKSQYLIDVTLRGSNNANLRGNRLDNNLTGNSGNNIIHGAGGDDEIDGGGGDDVAVFTGLSDEYEITKQEDATIVSDVQSDRDGIDRLSNIEFIHFSDKKIEIN